MVVGMLQTFHQHTQPSALCVWHCHVGMTNMPCSSMWASSAHLSLRRQLAGQQGGVLISCLAGKKKHWRVAGKRKHRRGRKGDIACMSGRESATRSIRCTLLFSGGLLPTKAATTVCTDTRVIQSRNLKTSSVSTVPLPACPL